MVSEHALLRAVSFLFLGIVVNASLVPDPRDVVNANAVVNASSAADGSVPGVALSSSSFTCYQQAVGCEGSYTCIYCVTELSDDDGTDDGGSSTSDTGVTCNNALDDAICDVFGSSSSCLANDEYVAYVECVLEAAFGCPIDICGDDTEDYGCSDYHLSNGCPDGFRYTDGYCVGGVCDFGDCCTYDGDFDGTVGSFVGAYESAVFGGVASTVAAAFAGLSLF